jgi:hypothetical protein
MKKRPAFGPTDLLLPNRMRPLVSLLLFFGVLIVLMTVHKQMSGFKGGFGAGVGGSGAAYQEIGFQDLNEAELIYEKKKESFRGGEAIGARTGGSGSAYQEIGFADMKKKEGFRGGGGFGGQAIGGRTAGPNNIGDLGSAASFGEDEEQEQRKRRQLEEAFENIGGAGEVSGKPETSDVSGPADAALKQPRKPYNLLENLPPAPRGSISCLTAGCCAETDFETRTNLTGNFLQRTNNYKREFPDSCSAPLTELNLAFYNNAVLQKATSA